MGERNDMPSWGGYVPSSLESECSCLHSPSFNIKSSPNPDCPYETDKLGNIISTKDTIDEQDIYLKCDNTVTQNLNEDHLSWDEYFANISLLAALRSKDTNTKVGCVIVSQSNKILSTGYNGLPSGIDESLFPTTNDKEHNSFENTKYAYVTHAELNAILNTSVHDISGSKLYCTLFPCCECAKAIIQKGIKEVIYLSDKHHNDPEYIAARKLFNAANIITRQYLGRVFLLS